MEIGPAKIYMFFLEFYFLFWGYLRSTSAAGPQIEDGNFCERKVEIEFSECNLIFSIQAEI